MLRCFCHSTEAQVKSKWSWDGSCSIYLHMYKKHICITTTILRIQKRNNLRKIIISNSKAEFQSFRKHFFWNINRIKIRSFQHFVESNESNNEKRNDEFMIKRYSLLLWNLQSHSQIIYMMVDRCNSYKSMTQPLLNYHLSVYQHHTIPLNYPNLAMCFIKMALTQTPCQI